MSGAIGIIGVGHFAGYLVAGLMRGNPDLDIVLSPRNATQSDALARRHGVAVAADNAAVVARSSLVILATRPADAVEAVRGLPWREAQTLVSIAAGIPVATLEEEAAPARVVRAMPVSCVAIGESPTAIYPDDLNARALFNRLGVVLAAPDEGSFEAASVFGAVYGWVHALVAEQAAWAAAAGLPDEQARALAALITRGAAGMILDRMDTPIADMIEGLATRGGITRQGLDLLQDRAALEAWAEACQAVLDRIRSGSGPSNS
ncbi:MAG: pyrroline-5-carboxylate reductase dimerization domain-containing protein [Alphaproteobacteria bacterium]|nr:pyrroline-5-carboxylate reductase dimerization domain-containing protein [Alphaproteobacteria bacterium]